MGAEVNPLPPPEVAALAHYREAPGYLQEVANAIAADREQIAKVCDAMIRETRRPGGQSSAATERNAGAREVLVALATMLRGGR